MEEIIRVENLSKYFTLHNLDKRIKACSQISVKTLIEKLKEEGTSMVGIFHDLEFMEGLCDKTFNMQAGKIIC
ncbi:hypothetical protein F9B85_06000 [Heliorestis acidaminivorans]|uniref:Uncharacterized protein n=1 Tax=Heliorestis acidaminivorans TaxID=553427 RepID=A0A6I0F1X0_9FIRM|nr:hypothetical protein [Heliorestis acidaminivorans]KAB2953455.1 hypothetical protein F9B85_06000 [Heliorestis acidaminivorans]